MKSRALRLLESIWPPLAALRANKGLQKQVEKQLTNNDDYQASLAKWLEVLGTRANDPFLLNEAEGIEQAEARRKEVIESKASSLTAALGISITLFLVIPAIVGKDWGLSTPIAIVIAFVFIVAVIHLVTATYYAVNVSKVAAFFLSSTETLKSSFGEKDQIDRSKIIAQKLANIDMNVPALIIKSNYLAVAQTLFLRGVIFFGTGALLALIFFLLK